MLRKPSWLSSANANNVSQFLIAFAAFGALFYGIYHHQENKKQAKIDAAIVGVNRMSESVDKMTARYLDFIKDNVEDTETIKKIIRSEPFKINKSYHLISGKDGKVSAFSSNEIRFGIVNFLNGWETLAVLYKEGNADCNILYESRIASLVKGRKYIDALIEFSKHFGVENKSKKSSWNNFNELYEKIGRFCRGEDVNHSCISKIDRRDCGINTQADPVPAKIEAVSSVGE